MSSPLEHMGIQPLKALTIGRQANETQSPWGEAEEILSPRQKLAPQRGFSPTLPSPCNSFKNRIETWHLLIPHEQSNRLPKALF